jgi:hypothetical protein
MRPEGLAQSEIVIILFTAQDSEGQYNSCVIHCKFVKRFFPLMEEIARI